jgi:hypothetical protein
MPSGNFRAIWSENYAAANTIVSNYLNYTTEDTAGVGFGHINVSVNQQTFK